MARNRKNKSPKHITPDEVWSAGPLKMARFGNNVIFENNWPQEEFDKVQEKLLAEHPKVIADINQLVDEIAKLVSHMPAGPLLQLGWWGFARRQHKIVAEADIGPEEALALRMIDYIQSMIAAVPPRDDQLVDLDDENYKTLTTKVEKLFSLINVPYQICATAKDRADNEDFEINFAELKFRAQVYWTNVRGDRYQAHESAYLHEMFLPHSNAVEQTFGITAQQLAAELVKIVNHFAFGVSSAIGDMARFRADVLNAIEKRLEDGDIDPNAKFGELMSQAVKDNGWEDRSQSVFANLLGMDFFDIEKITNLPKSLLNELSWKPGEETEFLAPGAFCGWPLRVWPVWRRPFIRIDQRYFCFDPYSLSENIYRVMRQMIIRLRPDLEFTWNTIQSSTAEDLPFRYLLRILPDASIFRSVYYPIVKPDGTLNWAEADGIVIYDDVLLVAEVKSGAFTQAPPTTDFPLYIRSVKKLLLEPTAQGQRFLDYLCSAEEVQIFDASHVPIGVLRRGEFRHMVICPITLDVLTELAAQAQHLKQSGMDVGANPLWALSIDDLRAYADVFDNPLTFLHFLEQRVAAFRADAPRLEDELEHLGMYLKHNQYSVYAQEMHVGLDRMSFVAYRNEIDKFFSERMANPAAPCFLKQKCPGRFVEIIDVLATSTEPGRARVASALLDCDDEWRSSLAEWIDQEIAKHPFTKRAQPLSINNRSVGGHTIYCWTSLVPRDSEKALDHARTVLLLQNDARRLLIELIFAENMALEAVKWTWLERSNITIRDVARLSPDVERLRTMRLSKAAADSKIGRNDPCPCGSSKKYKKCCQGR